MGKEQYISLIAKQLSNELNSSELRELNIWLSGNSDSQDALADFKDIWSSVSTYKATASFDTDAAFSRFSEKYDISSDSKQENTSDTAIVESKANSSVSRIVLIVVTILALMVGAWFLNKEIVPSFKNDGFAALPIQLTENASATLKPNSSLSFNQDNNTVSSLTGGAYFDLEGVEKANSIALKLPNAKVQANNAILNVDNYDGEDLITSVKKGSVQVNLKENNINVDAGQALTINKESGQYTLSNAGKNDFLWETGTLAFDNTPLDEAFSLIEKFYGVEVNVQDSSISDAHITATILNDLSLNDCLELIASTVSMKITRSGKDGKVIHITDIKAK